MMRQKSAGNNAGKQNLKLVMPGGNGGGSGGSGGSGNKTVTSASEDSLSSPSSAPLSPSQLGISEATVFLKANDVSERRLVLRSATPETPQQLLSPASPRVSVRKINSFSGAISRSTPTSPVNQLHGQQQQHQQQQQFSLPPQQQQEITDTPPAKGVAARKAMLKA